MEFYTANGWAGSEYERTRHLSLVEICKLARTELRERLPNCKFSVTQEVFSGGGSIRVVLMSAPFEAIRDEKIRYTSVNHMWMDNQTHLTDEAIALLKEVVKIFNKYNYDDSDGMIDYFSTKFYLSVGVGKWKKPFVKI
jgi:hypothetical protein